MASVTEVKSPEKAAAWTKALIFGVPTEYGRKRSSQDARWLKYRGDITLNNLSTAVLQAAMVCICTYMPQFLCVYLTFIVMRVYTVKNSLRCICLLLLLRSPIHIHIGYVYAIARVANVRSGEKQ